VFDRNKKRKARDIFDRGVVWCGERGCFCGPWMRHPFPLRYQSQDRYTVEVNLGHGTREEDIGAVSELLLA